MDEDTNFFQCIINITKTGGGGYKDDSHFRSLGKTLVFLNLERSDF